MRAAILIHVLHVYFVDEMGLFHELNFSASSVRIVVISIIYVGFRCDEGRWPSENCGDICLLASLKYDIRPDQHAKNALKSNKIMYNVKGTCTRAFKYRFTPIYQVVTSL